MAALAAVVTATALVGGTAAPAAACACGGIVSSDLGARVTEMISEAVECEFGFAEDLLSQGVAGMSLVDMREYLQYVADQRLLTLGLSKVYGSKNPFAFMELQDVQELTNFFERTVSAYQTAVDGEFSMDEEF